MYIFVKFDCKDLKQYDFPFMDNTIIWIWITNKFNWEGGGGGGWRTTPCALRKIEFRNGNRRVNFLFCAFEINSFFTVTTMAMVVINIVEGLGL